MSQFVNIVPYSKTSNPNTNNTDFISQLLSDISKTNKIKKNAFLFTLNRNLVKYDLVRTAPLDKYPIEIYYGTCYLIKNNSIFEFDTHPIDECPDIRSGDKHTGFKTLVTVHNLDLTDVGGMNSVEAFVDTDEMTSYDLDQTHNFMHALFRTGFDFWITDKKRIDNIDN